MKIEVQYHPGSCVDDETTRAKQQEMTIRVFGLGSLVSCFLGNVPCLPPRLSRSNLIMGIVLLALGVTILAASGFLARKTIGYRVIVDGQERSVAVRINRDKIVLHDNTGFKRECTLQEFDRIAGKKSTIVSSNKLSVTVLGCTYIGMGTFLVLMFGLKTVRENCFLALMKKMGTPDT